MTARRSSILCFVVAVLVVATTVRNAYAAAITAATGTPLVTAATGSLKSAGLGLITQAGQDIWAAATSEAWTWNYAFVPFSSDTKNDTTLNLFDGNNDLNVAHAEAHKSTFFGRKADAIGTADKQSGFISAEGTANKFAVAKSFAGVGSEVKTGGAGIIATILAKLTEIALDPPMESLLPGSDVLDKLGGTVGSSQNPVPVASFLYEIDLTPPQSATSESPYALYNATGQLLVNSMTGELSLAVQDTLCSRADNGTITCGVGNLLTATDFAPMFGPDGTTKIGYKLNLAPTQTEFDISIPFTVPSLWNCEGAPDCDPNFGITTIGGIYVAATAPEPGVLALLAIALIGMRSARRVKVS